MKKLYKFAAMFLAMMMAVATACEPTPTPEPEPEPEPKPEPVELTFDVSIDEVTYSSVTYSITPSVNDAEYLTVVLPESFIDETGVGEGLINAIMADLKAAAASSGKTMAEFMPTITDKGAVSGETIDMLALNTDYSLVVFGVDAANNYAATTEALCTPFTTEDMPQADCTFEVTTTVNGTSVNLSVVPSDKETLWHLFIVDAEMYNYYTDPNGDVKMTDEDFYTAYLSSEIDSYLSYGYTMEQIMAGLFLKGDVELSAEGLTANHTYGYMVAAVKIEGDMLYVTTTPQYDTFTSGNVASSDLTFDIQLSNPESNRIDLKIIPSNLNETFSWLVGIYDGVSTDEEILDNFLAANQAWLDYGFMLYTGVQDFTADGPNYKYKVDAPDTDYYVLAVGYKGGVTTAPHVAKFRTLAAPSPADATFDVTVENLNCYGFDLNIDSSDATTYYFLGAVPDAEFNAEEIQNTMAADIEYMIEMMQMYDPSYTVVQFLGQYAWSGDHYISSSEIAPNTSYTVYIMAMNMDGTIAKMHTYPAIAVTPEVGESTPTIELVGYYSGDEENGALFGQPAATAGKAITVVKYGNLDKASALYYSTAYGDASDTEQYTDAYLFGYCKGYWYQAAIAQPYSFFVMNWEETQSVIAYTPDASGQPGGLARLAATPTADAKSPYSELEELVNTLNSTAQVTPLKKNILSEPSVNGFMTRENTSSVSLGNNEQEEITLPATIARPEMAMPTIESNSLRPLKHVQFVRTK